MDFSQMATSCRFFELKHYFDPDHNFYETDIKSHVKLTVSLSGPVKVGLCLPNIPNGSAILKGRILSEVSLNATEMAPVGAWYILKTYSKKESSSNG